MFTDALIERANKGSKSYSKGIKNGCFSSTV